MATQGATLPAGGVREFELTAQEVDWELFPGAVVRAWAYNGTVPGPELRVTEGDLVRVVFTNRLQVPTAVHWHGLDVPIAMDGVPGLTQGAVPPGGASSTSSWPPTWAPAGTTPTRTPSCRGRWGCTAR